MSKIGYFCVYEIGGQTMTMGSNYDHAATVAEFLIDSGVMMELCQSDGELTELNVDHRDGKDVQESIQITQINRAVKLLAQSGNYPASPES